MKKKGFTLIELLAVIVILAIIALIATPMIMDVIDKAKKGAVENSALGYLDGIEKYSMYGMIDNEGVNALTSGIYKVNASSGSQISEKVIPAAIEYKGETPTDGWVAIDSKGAVIAAYLKFDSYGNWVGYTTKEGAKATLTENAFEDVTITVENAETEVNKKIAPATNE